MLKRLEFEEVQNGDHFLPQMGTTSQQNWEIVSLSKNDIQVGGKDIVKNFQIWLILILISQKNYLIKALKVLVHLSDFLNLSIISGKKANVKKSTKTKRQLEKKVSKKSI